MTFFADMTYHEQLNSEKEIYMHAFKIFLEDLSYFL